MSENGDLNGWTALGMMLGGMTTAFGAMFGIKRKSSQTMDAARQAAEKSAKATADALADHAGRIRALEANYERDRKENRDSMTEMFHEIREMKGDVKVCKAILDERKKEL